jgi:hypothetical protein
MFYPPDVLTRKFVLFPWCCTLWSGDCSIYRFSFFSIECSSHYFLRFIYSCETKLMMQWQSWIGRLVESEMVYLTFSHTLLCIFSFHAYFPPRLWYLYLQMEDKFLKEKKNLHLRSTRKQKLTGDDSNESLPRPIQWDALSTLRRDSLQVWFLQWNGIGSPYSSCPVFSKVSPLLFRHFTTSQSISTGSSSTQNILLSRTYGNMSERKLKGPGEKVFSFRMAKFYPLYRWDFRGL